MKIKIITDSTSDISKEFAEKNNVTVLPIGIEINGEFYSEGVDITSKEFYDKFKACEQIPHTSQINEFAFNEVIEKYKNTDTFFCIMPISKELSNTYYSAESAIKNYPKEKFFLCDTKTATAGLSLLVDYAVKLSNKKDITPDAFIKEIELFKSKISVFAIISDLKYLKMGGRLSASATLIGSILKITPLVTIDGKVKIVSKHIGKNKSFGEMAKLVSNRDFNYPVYFGHSDCEDMMVELIQKEKDVLMLDDKVQYFDIGAAIGTHAGPGIIAVAFVKKD
jgi:DegV family protein with EDD domain